MATITYVRTIKYVAEILGEDPELLRAIISNDDNLTYGSIISVYNGEEESITALTDDGMLASPHFGTLHRERSPVHQIRQQIH